MAQKALSTDQLRQAYEAVSTHGSIVLAAKSLGKSSSTFAHHWSLAKEWATEQGLPISGVGGQMRQSEPSPRLPVSADECWTVLDGFIGRTKKKAMRPPAIRKGDTKRLVIASDFHAPFQSNHAVSELIAREAKTTDTLILAGDVQDFYSISRFVKYEHVPIEQELAAVDALLGQLSAAFSDILIIAGNHDHARFEKQIRSLLSPEMMHVVEYLTGGQMSVIKALAKRYPNIRFGGHQVERHHVSWFTQVGDLLVTHAEKFSVVPGSALRAIESWFSDQQDILDLKPWRVIAQAHTHQLGIFPFKSDKLLCEVGCFSSTHGYMLQARVGGRPQRRGYVKLDQVKGETDINSVRMVWLDADRERAA